MVDGAVVVSQMVGQSAAGGTWACRVERRNKDSRYGRNPNFGFEAETERKPARMACHPTTHSPNEPLKLLADAKALHEAEPWRTKAEARAHISSMAGRRAVSDRLSKPVLVLPRPSRASSSGSSSSYPQLSVSPAELFRHILSSLSPNTSLEGSTDGPTVEVFGSVATKIFLEDLESQDPAAADDAHSSARRTEPTDLDARFYVPSCESFHHCREVVEDFLNQKMIEALPKDSELRDAACSGVVRQVYFQKQALVENAFSLLSIGDSASGRNIDLEFTLIGNGHRKYFDDANSLVLSLPLPALEAVCRGCAPGSPPPSAPWRLRR